MSSIASSSPAASAGGDAAPLSGPSLIAAFRAASESEMADFLQQMDRGMAIWAERRDPAAAAEAGAASKAPKTKKAAVGRPKKAVAAVAVLALPEAEDGAPDASAYRLAPEDIDHDTCLARSLDGGEDKRWSPIVYREKQCGKSVVEGSDLCATCAARLARFAEDPTKGMRSKWFSRVTEEPPSYAHMLGAQWATDKPPKWRGASADAEAASDAASDSGSEKQMSVASAPKVSAAEKETAAAAKKAASAAAKEAAAAVKKAEKEAAAAEKKAAKEAEAAAKKAAKEAEAAAKKAEKAAAKPKKEAKADAKPKKAAAAASVPAKADTAAVVAEAEGEMTLIDGTMYWLRNGNVYEYDSMTESAGDFVGRLGADGESIDTDAEEVTGAESDAE